MTENMNIAVLSQGLLSRIVVLFENCLGYQPSYQTKENSSSTKINNGFHLHMYIHGDLCIYLETSSVMALALPGQCVTEAITIKKTYLPKLI